jgi:plasmid stabilization system protein ParE
MKVVYTPAALSDLDQIAEWLAFHYPTIAPAVEGRIRAVVARIGQWPESARRSAKRAGVRVVPVGRYPYRIFYRVTADAVEILHIHHAAREPWDERE